ncbi:MAG: DUF362 domain-containing protein [Polyangiaceae bacterium]|nr:DUF362 domain-containing protein [Polyangiaceae bacterium]
MRRAASLILLLLAASCGEGSPKANKSSTPIPSSSAVASGEPPASASTPVESSSADVVTQASQPYEGPPVLAEGKLDGAALRARNLERVRKDDSPVIALAGDDPVALAKKLCEAVVPKRGKDVPVLVKPNIGGFDSIKDPEKSGGDDGVTGRITNPEFVRGIIRCLKERGHTKITIADGWGGPHSYWNKLVDISGYAKMTKEEGVPLVCMCDDGTFDVEGDRPGKPMQVSGMGATKVPTLLLPKVLAEHMSGGLFIEVPKLKAHRFSVVSLGLKNMQGVVMSSLASPAHRQKWRMHAELKDYLDGKSAGNEDRAAYVKALDLFAARMVDVSEVAMPDVVLLDGTPAMQGDGFQMMVPIEPKIGIGGTNIVRVDQAGAMFLGAWDNEKLALGLGGHKTSPLIELAAKRFGVDLSKTRIEGDASAAVLEPRAFVFKAMAPFQLTAKDVPKKPGSTTTSSPAGAATAKAAALGAEKLVLDGVLDEPAWSRATPIEFSTDWKGRATSVSTRVRFLWSSDALYAAFESESAGFFTDATQPTDRDRARLYEEDCIELFLAPDTKARHKYFEVEVGPFGHFLDLSIDRQAKREDVGWSGALGVGTRRDAAAKKGVIEIAIKAPEIRSALKSGAELGLGVFRMEGRQDRKFLAWSPTFTDRPNFHVTERFGTLVVE